MRTVIALENSNCARCHNRMLYALRATDRVQRVQSDFSTGCLVIEHDTDPEALVELITTTGRSVAVAANGERVMVTLDGHEEPECRLTADGAHR